MSRLISFSGLPGAGKTTLSRALAKQINAAYLRVDSVEVAMKNSALKIHQPEDASYLILVSLAKDNLRLGSDVIVDTVNPLAITRTMWTEAACETKSELINIEITCEDQRTHKARIESRASDIRGLTLPTWSEVTSREYEPWSEDRITIDTSHNTEADCIAQILEALEADK